MATEAAPGTPVEQNQPAADPPLHWSQQFRIVPAREARSWATVDVSDDPNVTGMFRSLAHTAAVLGDERSETVEGLDADLLRVATGEWSAAEFIDATADRVTRLRAALVATDRHEPESRSSVFGQPGPA